MKKFLLLCAAFTMVTCSLKAQKDYDRYPHYEGSFSLGYGVGVGKSSNIVNTDRIYFETAHGVRLNPYVYWGLGVGFSHFYGIEDAAETSSLVAMIPVFTRVMVGSPLQNDASVFLSMDMGCDIGVGKISGSGNFMFGVGPEFRYRQLTVGSQFKIHKNCPNEVLIKLGVNF